MEIKQIRLEKNGFYTIVFTEGQEVQVSEDLLVKYRLLKGSEITAELFETLKASAGYQIGLQMAYNYVSYQLRSEKEMYQYLKKKEVTTKDAKEIIARLKELNLVDDQVYAESYIRTQIRMGDKGPYVLSQNLKQKGIDPLIIEQALYLYTIDDQQAIAIKVAEKSWRKNQNKSYQENLQKIRATLMQKGFGSEVIQLVFDELSFEKDEEAEENALFIEGAKLLRRHQRLDRSKKIQKIKNQLYQKGFSLDQIQHFIDEEVIEDE